MRDENNEIKDFDYDAGNIDPYGDQQVLMSENNEAATKTIDTDISKIETLASEEVSNDQLIEDLLSRHEEAVAAQSLPKALLGGLIASVICVSLWVLITVLTRYQISYMAIGVGFGVGYFVLRMGQGLGIVYGVVGAFFSLLACVLGNFLSQMFFISIDMEIPLMNCLTMIDLQLVKDVMIESFHPMDLLFYGIALYTGFKISIKDAI